MTQKQLKKIISYDPKTGIISRNNSKKPNPKQVNHNNNGLRIMINRTSYRHGRLIWFYMVGHWPKGEVDHIDGNSSNNKLNNLRDVTSGQNKFNMNRIGYTIRKNRRKKYFVRVRVEGREISIGYFLTTKEARKQYVKAKIKHHGIEFCSRIPKKEKREYERTC